MALKKADEEKLTALLKGFDIPKLIEVIKATEEQDFVIPEKVSVLTEAELTLRDTNVANTAKTDAEKTGETKGKELAAKAFRKKFNAPDTLGADVDKVVEWVSATLATGDAGLKQQITGLQADKDTLEKKLQDSEKIAKTSILDMKLISMFPPGRDSNLSDDERLMLVKKNIEIIEDATTGAITFKKDGKIIEDPATHSPLPGAKAMESLFTERKWIGDDAGAGGGRGGGNRGGGAGAGSVKKLSAYKQKWMADNPGKNVMSAEFDADLQKHVKDIPDFEYDAE